MHLRVDGPHGFVLGEGSRSRCRRSGSGRAPGLPERDGTASPAAPRGARAGGAGLERGDPDRPGTGRTGDRSPAELHPPPCGAVRRPLRIRHAVGGRTRRRAAAPGAVPNGRPPVLAQAPLVDERAMLGYAGSVAFSGDGREIAITPPPGRPAAQGPGRRRLPRSPVARLPHFADRRHGGGETHRPLAAASRSLGHSTFRIVANPPPRFTPAWLAEATDLLDRFEARPPRHSAETARAPKSRFCTGRSNGG